MFQRPASERIFGTVREILDRTPRGRLDRHVVEAHVRVPIETLLQAEQAKGAITAYALTTDTDPDRFLAGILDVKVEVLVPRQLDLAEWKTLKVSLDTTAPGALAGAETSILGGSRPLADGSSDRPGNEAAGIEIRRSRDANQASARQIRMDFRASPRQAQHVVVREAPAAAEPVALSLPDGAVVQSQQMHEDSRRLSGAVRALFAKWLGTRHRE